MSDEALKCLFEHIMTISHKPEANRQRKGFSIACLQHNRDGNLQGAVAMRQITHAPFELTVAIQAHQARTNLKAFTSRSTTPSGIDNDSMLVPLNASAQTRSSFDDAPNVTLRRLLH